ncbi:MAG: OmpH family outer membrane protein [Bacteroidales bacterium]|nr:OmpH family outer membrane protein [Candidatus Liminaster caballi]
MKTIKILASALILAGALVGGMSSCNQQQSAACAPVAACDSLRLPIAYINVDSLLVNYDYAKDLNEELLKKTEDARMKVNAQGQALEKETAAFQKKLQTNAFLSEERAQSEYNRLQTKQQELEQLNYNLQNELAQQQAQMNARLSDTIRTFIKEYNKVMKFELIFTNTMYDNILLDNPKYDITTDVLNQLNERYAKSKK